MTHSVKPKTLYVVSTPIGNFGDLTERAAHVLQAVDAIAAEDTRRTGMLMKWLRDKTCNAENSLALDRRPAMLSFHAHNWRSRAPQIMERLHSGQSVAVVSDAGTPCVSDPGSEIVAQVVAAGLRVVPIPGACAAIAALVCAVIPSGTPFIVLGFLPRAGKRRKDYIAKIDDQYKEVAVVMYEAPHRLRQTLADLAGSSQCRRTLCIAREVTKKHEDIRNFPTVAAACKSYDIHPCGSEFKQETDSTGDFERPSPFHEDDELESLEDSQGNPRIRGEYTIVLGPTLVVSEEGADSTQLTTPALVNKKIDVHSLIQEMVQSNIPVKTVARIVSTALDVPRKQVYNLALAKSREIAAGCGAIDA